MQNEILIGAHKAVRLLTEKVVRPVYICQSLGSIIQSPKLFILWVHSSLMLVVLTFS